MCFPLRTVAFRGHGFSLLALAKGMSTLFAKNGFSRPSLKYSGLFRPVLSPQESTASTPNNQRKSKIDPIVRCQTPSFRSAKRQQPPLILLRRSLYQLRRIKGNNYFRWDE